MGLDACQRQCFATNIIVCIDSYELSEVPVVPFEYLNS